MNNDPIQNTPSDINTGEHYVPDHLSYLAMLLDNVSDAIISFDKNKVITLWNTGAERIYGWTKDEALGRDSANLLRSEAPEEVRDSRLKEVETEGELRVEAVHYTKANKRIIVESKVLPIKNGNGEVTGYTAVNKDITKSRQTEENLKESELKYSALFNNKTMGVAHCKIITDESGNPVDFMYLQVNYAYLQITGAKIEDVEGKLFTERFPKARDLSVDYVKIYGNIALKGEELEFETYFEVRKRWYIVYGYSPKQGEFTLLFSDITSRKNAESALKESESNLREAQSLAHIGTSVYDYVARKYSWTEEAFRIYELDPAKGEPTYEEIVKFLHPDDFNLMMEKIKEAEKTKEPVRFEYRIILPGNRIKHIDYTLRTIFDESGRPVKRIGTAMDITEAKNYRLKLEKTLVDLKRSNHELEQFAYVASHDLQEPIRMVSTYTKMLELQLKDGLNEKQKQYMFFLIDGAKRMHNLIQDLLAYSRVTSKNETFVLTDLNGVMAEIMRDLQVAITDHNAEVICNDLPALKTDPSQIRLVFQNLIQNAIKFNGDKKPVIQINAERKRKEWLFSVKDNGIGIDPEYHERIFVIFQRLYEKEKYPGTGIGLSICKKIVERQGGKIWVESELGKGATFYFTLPD